MGQEFIKVLEQRNFPYRAMKMLASAKSAGKKVMFDGREYVIEELTEASFDGVEIGLFSAGGSISKKFGPIAAAKGCMVVDNSSAFRMTDGVPLVIPEVNPEAMKGMKAGKGKGGIIANPNCSTIIALMAVTPLHRVARVTRMVVSTYQAASGAGAAAMAVRCAVCGAMAGAKAGADARACRFRWGQELEQQTREALAGQPITKNIFKQQARAGLRGRCVSALRARASVGGRG